MGRLFGEKSIIERVETLQIHELMQQRWSPRAFSEKALEPEKLKTLFEAARWAASSNNEQPWRFLVAQNGTEAFAKLTAALVGFNQMWAPKAPVMAVSFGKKTFTGRDMANPYALHDTGAALANLALQATALGLQVHAMGGFDRNAVREAFAVPDDFEAGAVFVIGYPGDPNTLPDPLKERELAVRTRKGLDEIVFADTFGVPAQL